MTRIIHCINHWLNDLGHDFFMDILSDHWRRRVCSHTACVRTCIAFKSPFMVLARCHWQDIFTINHADKAGFFTLQKLLNHHAAACITKLIVRKHVIDGLICLFDSFCNDDTFTSGKAISFDNDGCTLFIDISFGSYRFGEAFVGCGRDIVLFHEFFGKGFGAF